MRSVAFEEYREELSRIGGEVQCGSFTVCRGAYRVIVAEIPSTTRKARYAREFAIDASYIDCLAAVANACSNCSSFDEAVRVTNDLVDDEVLVH